MKQLKYILLFLTIYLVGCSGSNDSFSLVCKGKTKVDTMVFYLMVSSKVIEETRTYTFVNKKYKDNECKVFNNERILCDLSEVKNPEYYLSNIISIDRLSGKINELNIYTPRNSKEHERINFDGICEKSKSKF